MAKAIYIAALLLCLAACTKTSDDTNYSRYDSQLMAAGTLAPDFNINDSLALSSLQGRYVVLVFWASWCPDCQEATPAMVSLYNTFAADSISFVGVSFDTDTAAMSSYARQHGMLWPQYCEGKAWKETDIQQKYSVRWIPTIYILGKDRRVVAGSVNPDNIRARLNTITQR